MTYLHCLACGLLISFGLHDQDGGPTRPNAAAWKTWVLKSADELRLSAPNVDPNVIAAETAWVRNYMADGGRSPDALRQLRYWTAGAPSYRWIQLLLNQIENKPLATNQRSVRAIMLIAVAINDATMAAWDSKYAFNRPGPADVGPASLASRTPSYPSELAVTAAAAAEMLAYLWPADAEYFRTLSDEASRASLTAGYSYPSDVTAGVQLGRAVAAQVINWARNDGSDAVWTGRVPNEPGLWNGTNPVEPLMGTWKTFVLTTGSQFRAPPPFAYNSLEKQAELAEVRNFPRGITSLATNQKSLYYQAAEGAFSFWYSNISQRLLESKLDSDPPFAARAYALAAVAHYEAQVACWDSKYAYWAIRPFQLDPNVTTLFNTPNHPSYPAAHGCGSGALGRVIGRLFPDYADFMEAKANEAADSRLWGGIHYRSDLTSGLSIGRKVGDLVMEKAAMDGSR